MTIGPARDATPAPIERPGLTGRAWIALAALSLAALLLRLGYLWWSADLPGFAWVDPDNYLGEGRRLIDRRGEWRWSYEAVRYQGGYYKAPLYPVFLSLVARITPFDYGWSVAIVETLLGAALVPMVFQLGRLCHSNRAGWIAAGLQTIDLQQIQLAGVFRQEEVYIPAMTAALVCLGAAIERGIGVGRFVTAGLLTGIAALARSMPVMFVGPVAAAIVIWAGWRSRGPACAAGFVAGFLIVVVPYSVMLSSRANRPILIENIGGYGFALTHPEFLVRPPTTAETVRLAAENMAPAVAVPLARGVLRPSGGRALQTMNPMPDRWRAAVITWMVRVGDDLLVSLVLLTAPFGLLLARNRRVAWMLGLWCVINLGAVVLAGYSGPRFRSPFMVELIVFAAVVLAGSWRTIARPARWGGAVLTLIASWIIVEALPRSLDARVDYGLTPWVYDSGARRASASGDAGFTAYPIAGMIRLSIEALEPSGTTAVSISVDGREPRTVGVSESGVHLDLAVAPDAQWVFVETRSSRPLEIVTR